MTPRERIIRFFKYIDPDTETQEIINTLEEMKELVSSAIEVSVLTELMKSNPFEKSEKKDGKKGIMLLVACSMVEAGEEMVNEITHNR